MIGIGFDETDGGPVRRCGTGEVLLDRREAGPTAPACGLFLMRVTYPEASGAV